MVDAYCCLRDEEDWTSLKHWLIGQPLINDFSTIGLDIPCSYRIQRLSTILSNSVVSDTLNWFIV